MNCSFKDVSGIESILDLRIPFLKNGMTNMILPVIFSDANDNLLGVDYLDNRNQLQNMVERKNGSVPFYDFNIEGFKNRKLQVRSVAVNCAQDALLCKLSLSFEKYAFFFDSKSYENNNFDFDIFYVPKPKIDGGSNPNMLQTAVLYDIGKNEVLMTGKVSLKNIQDAISKKNPVFHNNGEDFVVDGLEIINFGIKKLDSDSLFKHLVVYNVYPINEPFYCKGSKNNSSTCFYRTIELNDNKFSLKY